MEDINTYNDVGNTVPDKVTVNLILEWPRLRLVNFQRLLYNHEKTALAPVGLPFPLSYNHLLFNETVAFPVAKPDELLPRLLSNGEEVLAAEAPPTAFCIKGLTEKGLPEGPLLTPSVLWSNEEGDALCDMGDAEVCFCALERGVDERE